MSNATAVIPTSNLYGVVASLEQSAATVSLRDCFPNKIPVSFMEVKAGRKIFALKRPLDLMLERTDNGWSCAEPILSLFGFGKSSAAAVCSIFQDFSVLWDEIAEAPDETLAEDAIRTKRELLSFVKSVAEV